MALNRLIDQQITYNLSTSNHEGLFHTHRKELTRLIIQHSPPHMGRLCVLGAGNCNDLDLSHLFNFYSEIHLVDLDREALLAGTASQSMKGFPNLHLHTGIDVTGVLETLSKWLPGQLNQEKIDQATIQVQNFFGLPFLGVFDTVVSTCLLTQLMDSVSSLCRTERLPWTMTQALRARHLRLLAELLTPRGTGILVTDFSSSDIFPELSKSPNKPLCVQMEELIRRRLYFSGTNPYTIQAFLEKDPLTSSLVHQVQISQPWLWNLSTKRFFIVCAVNFQKKRQCLPPSGPHPKC